MSEHKAQALKSLHDRSKLQLQLAKADGDADSAEWHAEMIRQARAEAEAEAQGIITGKRGTWALSQRSARTVSVPMGSLFGERSLFDAE